jgi:hypothetical protein
MRYIIPIVLVATLFVGSLAVIGYETYSAISGTGKRVALTWRQAIFGEPALRLCQKEPYAVSSEEVKRFWTNRVAVILQYVESGDCLYITERFLVRGQGGQEPPPRQSSRAPSRDDSPSRLPVASGGYFR